MERQTDVDGRELLADPTRLIDWFDDFAGAHPYRALSNFYVGDPFICDVGFGPCEYQTGEHAFQAAKACDSETHAWIASSTTPAIAKGRGRQCELRGDWEEIKYLVMRIVLQTKFTKERREGDILLDTGDALLVEGTYWRDRVWGVDLNASGRPGQNWLGTLLMARRAELRAAIPRCECDPPPPEWTHWDACPLAALR